MNQRPVSQCISVITAVINSGQFEVKPYEEIRILSEPFFQILCVRKCNVSLSPSEWMLISNA